MYPPIMQDTFAPQHLMRSWEQDGFLVELYETGAKSDYHHSLVAYRLYDIDWALETGNADVIFEGTDYGIPSHQVIDDDEAVRGLCGFLSLRPGDTDAEYFADYTERQTTWAEARAETLGLWSLDGVDMATGEFSD
jgi:hypothetical protein